MAAQGRGVTSVFKANGGPDGLAAAIRVFRSSRRLAGSAGVIVLQGEQRKLEPVLGANLLEEPGKVYLHRPFGDPQCVPEFFVLEALGQQRHQLPLPPGQGHVPRGQQFVAEVRFHPELSRPNLLQAVQLRGDGQVSAQDPANPRRNCLGCELGQHPVHPEHNRAPRKTARKFSHSRQGYGIRQLHQNHVRLARTRLRLESFDRLVCAGQGKRFGGFQSGFETGNQERLFGIQSDARHRLAPTALFRPPWVSRWYISRD